MRDSAIEWTHHTFNPWEGCTKISPGCKNCYAAARNERFHDGKHWGQNAPRLLRSEAYWRQPLKWNKSAAERGVRERVFCASLADVFEDQPDLVEPRRRLFQLIDRTTASLDWLLLTKRPENIRRLWDPVRAELAAMRGHIDRRNVWLGTTCEDQQRADERIPHLLACRDLASKLFVSYEPALEAIDFSMWMPGWWCRACKRVIRGRGDAGCAVDEGEADPVCPFCNSLDVEPRTIDWLIVGGESGPGARPFDLALARSAAAQCRAAGVPIFIKQLGAWPIFSSLIRDAERPGYVQLRDRKGGDMAEWPSDLRVREVPA